MALTKAQKKQIKDDFNQFLQLGRKFAKADVRSLYVIDKSPILESGSVLGDLLPKLVKAAWTRGKQGHKK